MAKIPKINLSSTISSYRINFNRLLDSIGDLQLLNTDSTATIVGAINSLDSNQGTRLSLTTSNKTNLVAAINEHSGELGTITSGAMGTTASTVSGAIAELDARLDSINNTQLNTPQVTATDVDISNTLEVDGFFTARGGVILGNASGDLIYPFGSFNLDVLPATDSSFNLGSDTKRWKNVYAQNLSADSGTINGNLNIIGNLTASTQVIADSAVIQGIIDSNFTDSNEIATLANRSIANSKLVNNTITINGVEFSLGESKAIDTTDSGVQVALIRSVLRADSNSGIHYDSATLKYSLSNIPNSSLTNNSITINDTTFNLGDNSSLDVTDSSAVINIARNAVSVTASTGLSYNAGTGAFSGVNATTAVKGVAKFNSASFTTSAGTISIKNDGILNAQILNDSFSVNGISGALGTDITVDITDSAAVQSMIDSSFTDMPAIIARTGDFLIDASGDITLDAEGNDIFFTNGATAVARHYFASDDYNILVTGTNQDINLDASDGLLKLDGNDGVRILTGAGNEIRFYENATQFISIDFPSGTEQRLEGTHDLTFNSPQITSLEGGSITLDADGTGGYSDKIYLENGGTRRGNIEIGASINGFSIYTGAAQGTLNATFEGEDLTVQGDITSISDERTKENVETIANGLEIVDTIRGVYYNKIGETERKVGVIAQEVETVLPEVVKTNDEGMKSVDYGKIIGVLVEAIKDLKHEIDDLKRGL
jgi:hypothetical protein